MAGGSPETFVADIGRWIDKAHRNGDAVMRQACQQASIDVIMHTPVDTGNAAGGWFALINSRGFQKSSYGHDLGITAALQDALPQAAKVKWGDVFFLGNNVEYILPLEYGHSKQAPSGMVRVTVARLPAIVEQYAKRLGA